VQVLTPATEQVLFTASPVSPEQTWRKRGWYWQRSGALTTTELEQWAGASHDDAMPGELNDTLYMSLGQVPTLEVVVWGRRWLWTFVAGGVLAAGLLVRYLSRSRSIVLLAALLVVGLIATLVAPELALNVSQYGGVGLLLLIAVAWSLRVTGAPSGQRLGPGQGSTIYRPEPRRTESRAARRGSSLTTPAAALAEAASEEAAT
jgi:hypothetical protein